MSKIYTADAGAKTSRYRDSPCSVCGIRPDESGKPVLLCSACKSIPYCGKECQRKGWSVHKTRCQEIRVLNNLDEKVSSPKEEVGISHQDVGNGRAMPALQTRYRLMEDFMRVHVSTFELAWTTAVWASTKCAPFKFDFEHRILKVDFKYRRDSKGDPSRAFEIITCRFHKLAEIGPVLRKDLVARKPLFAERAERLRIKHPNNPLRVLFILSILDNQAWIWSFLPIYEQLPAGKEAYARQATTSSWLRDLRDQLESGLVCKPGDVPSDVKGRLKRKGNKWVWRAEEQESASTDGEAVGIEEQLEETG